ncbi:unnamed protein product [Ascophyllum nodosum]
MKAVSSSIAVVATAAPLVSAFVGTPLPLRAFSRPFCAAEKYSARPLRMSAEAEKVDEDQPAVYYASEVTGGREKTDFTKTFGEQELEDFSTDENINHGPVNYDNFVDGEGFDGGDGQVGCVGDGSNAMETFDNKAAVRKQDMQAKLKTSTMVKDSKSRQRNAWGSTGTVSKSLYTVRGSTKEWRSKSPTSEARAVQALWEEALQKNVQLLFIPPSQTLGTFRLTPYQVCHRGPAVAVWNQTVSTVVTLTVQGYADKLKDEGMVNVNLKGEDTKTIRRQQFENWRNQQEITNMQRSKMAEMDRMTGVDTDLPKWKKGKASYFDEMNKPRVEENSQDWNKYNVPHTTGKKDGTEWAEATLTGNEKVQDTITCISVSGRPGHASLQVKNSVMTFEPFHCSWAGDSVGFSVNPAEGTLNRRNGDPTLLDVAYLGKGPADNRIGTLVVETEEDKWVYKVRSGSHAIQ